MAPPTPGRRRQQLVNSARALVAPVVGLVAFFGVWQLLVTVFDVPAFELPAPSRILEGIAADPSFYLHNAWVTGQEAFLGFALALLLALVAGTAMTYSRFLERAVYPVAVLIQVTPIIAYAPAFVIWLGAGLKPILAITTLVCFVPFLFNAVAGLRSVDPATHELLRSVDANGREIFWRLRLPHALPYLFAAGRIAVGLALIGAVLGEWFALVDEGLGVAIRKALNFNDVEQLWGSILTLGFLGGVALIVLGLVERVALHWHPSQVTLSP
jgi:NitT/TauT family transport system permease protein